MSSQGVKEDATSLGIGTRGVTALQPVLPYLDSFFLCLNDPYHPISNRKGYIALCVAENKLVQDDLSDYFRKESVSGKAFLEDEVYCYNDNLGLPCIRESLAKFLTKKFLYSGITKDDEEEKESFFCNNNGVQRKIESSQIVVSSGCAALVNYLFYTLLEEGDCVLIPAPYYAAFENDMKVIAKCLPYPVHLEDPLKGPSSFDLERAYKKAEKEGLKVKSVLLTNPNNPLGVVYEPDIILNVIEWARSKSKDGSLVHTIVDEIYGLSVHEKANSHKFHSVLKILKNDLRKDVHFLWGLSKDFGSSGFRFGVLCTQNKKLVQALGTLNIFSSVSHPIQKLISNMLEDDSSFVDEFLDKSRYKLYQSYKKCIASLEDMSIPYVDAIAGMFVYCNFSSLLPPPSSTTTTDDDIDSSSSSSSSFEREAKFFSIVSKYAHIVMTPGEAQRECPEKVGMFRICYAYVSLEVLDIAMRRLKKIARTIVEVGWENLDPDIHFKDVLDA